MNGANGDFVSLKERCVGLLFSCPEDQARPDCPFAEVRRQDVLARVMWLKQRSLAELQGLYGQHVNCLTQRRTARQNPG